MPSTTHTHQSAWTTNHVYGFEKYATRSARPRRRTVSQRFHLGMVSLTAILLTAITVFTVLYLLYANLSATKGFELQRVQKMQDELADENKVLNMQIAELRSLKNLADQGKRMVVAGSVTRISTDSRVALQ